MAGSDVVYQIVIKPEDHMIFGGDNIGRIIKRNRKEISFLVKERGLKAWQEGDKGQWRALCSDLLDFNRQEKERYSEPCQ